MVNPIIIIMLQEQLLLGLRFWVENNQWLQLHIVAEDFTITIALNQVQKMRQQAEDDTRMDKRMLTHHVWAPIVELYLSPKMYARYTLTTQAMMHFKKCR